jgi:tetratricopeptide (TPR) repeat protein
LDYSLKALYFAPRDPESFLALGSVPMPLELTLYPAQEAYRLNSLDLENGQSLAFTLFFLGRSREALRLIEDILSVEPDYLAGLYPKVLILADLGRISEAADLLPKVQKLMGSRYPPPALWLPLVLALQREDSAEADRLLKEILGQIHDPLTSPHLVGGAAVQLLSFLVRRGRMDAVLEILERNLEVGPIPLYDILMLDPRLEPLRQDARFKPLLEKDRQNFMECMKVLAEVRSRGELPRYLDAPFADLLKKLDIQF